jgi:hypothetical protein
MCMTASVCLFVSTQHYNDCQHRRDNVAWNAFCILIPMDNIVFPHSKYRMHIKEVRSILRNLLC